MKRNITVVAVPNQSKAQIWKVTQSELDMAEAVEAWNGEGVEPDVSNDEDAGLADLYSYHRVDTIDDAKELQNYDGHQKLRVEMLADELVEIFEEQSAEEDVAAVAEQTVGEDTEEGIYVAEEDGMGM